jgi:hypothetical protein
MIMQQDQSIIDMIKLVLQFAVLPLAGFMWAHYRTTQTHDTALAVMRSEHALVKESHDREFKEVKEAFRSVMSKLDEIQKALPR